LINPSAREYVEQIYNLYEKSRNKNDIQDAVINASSLQRSIHRYEAEILELAGIGIQWRRASNITKCVGDVVKWLEDLLCLAMVGAEELIRSYKSGTLLYQTI